MSRHYVEKALLATEYKIESNINQSGFFIRNFWLVLGFGIFVSAWAPTYRPNNMHHQSKSAMELSDFSYHEWVILTAILYTLACILAHFIWKWQDKKALNKLLNRKRELEMDLGIIKTTRTK